jgi:hypothetical protein
LGQRALQREGPHDPGEEQPDHGAKDSPSRTVQRPEAGDAPDGGADLAADRPGQEPPQGGEDERAGEEDERRVGREVRLRPQEEQGQSRAQVGAEPEAHEGERAGDEPGGEATDGEQQYERHYEPIEQAHRLALLADRPVIELWFCFRYFSLNC